jgi:hypothetical protein
MHPKTIEILMELSEAEKLFSKLVEKLAKDLSDEPVTFRFLGTPWEDDTFIWNRSIIFMDKPRVDVFPLTWMKCKLATAERLGLPKSSAYDGSLISTYKKPSGVRITFMLNEPSPSEVFTPENSYLLDVIN